MHRTIVIDPPFGGLGDTLFHSHIPRIAKQCGVETVLVSRRIDRRDNNYNNLVWDLNPYVDGFTGTAGTIPQKREKTNTECNYLDRVMLSYGLDDGKRHHEPEIYYKPNIKAELEGKTVYDPNFISFTGWLSQKRLQWHLTNNGYRFDVQLVSRDRSLFAPHPKPSYQCGSIFDFCDVLHSCKHYYCLLSGGSVLAAALGKPSTVFYGPKVDATFLHSLLHTYTYIHDPYWKLNYLKYYGIRRIRQLLGLRVLKP